MAPSHEEKPSILPDSNAPGARLVHLGHTLNNGITVLMGIEEWLAGLEDREADAPEMRRNLESTIARIQEVAGDLSKLGRTLPRGD